MQAATADLGKGPPAGPRDHCPEPSPFKGPTPEAHEIIVGLVDEFGF